MASELLKVSLNAGVTNSESVLLNGVNGHTYTILSIIITETAGAAETVDVYVDDGGGGTDYEILSDQAVQFVPGIEPAPPPPTTIGYACADSVISVPPGLPFKGEAV